MSGYGTNAWGYGSPSPVVPALAEADAGYGAPSSFPFVAVVAYPPGLELPDDGGPLVRVAGAWADGDGYTVTLTPSGGGTPVTCYAARVDVYDGSHGADAEAVAGVLTFAAPALPPDTYDIDITGPSGAVSLPSALAVVYRTWAEEVYNLRSGLPALHDAGAREMRDELLLVAANENAIRAEVAAEALVGLTETMGEQLRALYGRPVTRVRTLWSGGSTLEVESTLGYPDEGGLLASGLSLSYTGRTADTFTGVSLVLGSVLATLRPLTEVVCDVAAVEPP